MALADDPTALDELARGLDPYDCPACLDGAACEFHAGFAHGWDACAAFVAQAVGDQREEVKP